MPDLIFVAVAITLALIAAALFLFVTFRVSRQRLIGLHGPDERSAVTSGGGEGGLAEGARVLISSVTAPEQQLRAVVASVNHRMVELVTYSNIGCFKAPGAPVRLILPDEERALEAVVPLIDCKNISGVSKLFVGRPEWMQALQRRRNKRLSLDCPVTIIAAGESSLSTSEFAGTITDISVGGCGLTTNRRLRIGCSYRINLPMDGFTSERVVIIVTDCRSEQILHGIPYHIRCRFVEQSESLRKKIDQLTA